MHEIPTVNPPDMAAAFDVDEVKQHEDAFSPAGNELLRAAARDMDLEFLREASERLQARWDKAPTSVTASETPGPGTGLKFDTGKPRMDLVPPGALMQVAQVLTYGAKKYEANTDWQWRKGMAWSRPLAAALRHIFQWSAGQNLDKESGLSHLAHAAVNLLFLLTYQEQGTGHDDRCNEQTGGG